MLTTVKQLARAASSAALAAQKRDATIRQAHAEGMSIRQIAAAAGLSSARVHQILHGK